MLAEDCFKVSINPKLWEEKRQNRTTSKFQQLEHGKGDNSEKLVQEIHMLPVHGMDLMDGIQEGCDRP